ncbi:hypothetical protein Tco_0431450 [Tanacetum coccineum]
MKTSQNACAEELGLDAILPNGFLARTGDKGLVVINWAPQPEILSHDFVGNSALEAVVAGVQWWHGPWINPGIPRRHVAGIGIPGDMSPGISRWGKLERDSFPGDKAGPT